MKKLLLLVSLAILAASCDRGPSPAPSDATAALAKPIVVASNYPLYFFAREISGGTLDVVLPDIEGDPAMWRPGSDDIALLQRADRVLLNGAGYESWLNWVTLPAERLVDTSVSFHDRLIPLEHETVHQHGPAGEHSHAGNAFTVWLDPELAIAQAGSIEEALSDLAPQHRDSHRQNLAQLQKRLEELDEQQQRAFESLAQQPLLFSHPVYQYLERRYGLDGYSLHWEPNQQPGDKAWIDIGNMLRDHSARLMIWEDEPLASTQARLEGLGLATIPYRTAANRPETGDYFDVMAANTSRLLEGINGSVVDDFQNPR